LLVRYGFAGPVIIEIKLTSNKDMHTSEPEESVSYVRMKQYLEAYGGCNGILLIINNRRTVNLDLVKEAYAKIPHVWVKVFNCRRDDLTRTTRRRRTLQPPTASKRGRT
jgi:hypothetical protein